MRNWLFFLLKCNAFQAGFHGWLGGGNERERERERDCLVLITEPHFLRQIFTLITDVPLTRKAIEAQGLMK